MTGLAVPAPGVRLRGLRREEFEQMVERGMFVGEPVELLGGELVEMSPQGEDHEWVIEGLTGQLAPLAQEGYAVRVQLSLRVDDVSLPEPDVAVTDRRSTRARPHDAHVVIEVSASSLRYDLDHKGPRYAAAGIPLYIVLDLVNWVAHVHRDPGPQGYAAVTRLGATDQIEILDTPLDLGPLLTPADDE